MSQSDRVYCRLVLFSLFADGSRRPPRIYPAREKEGAAFVIRFNGSLSPFALFEFSIDQKRPLSRLADTVSLRSTRGQLERRGAVRCGRSGRGVFCIA